MTVTVTLRDGGNHNYMRFGDAYVKKADGALEVHRGGTKAPFSYGSGEWTAVAGDEKRWKRTRFWS